MYLRRVIFLLYLLLSLDELPNYYSSIHYPNQHIQQDVRQPVSRYQLPDPVCCSQCRPERCARVSRASIARFRESSSSIFILHIIILTLSYLIFPALSYLSITHHIEQNLIFRSTTPTPTRTSTPTRQTQLRRTQTSLTPLDHQRSLRLSRNVCSFPTPLHIFLTKLVAPKGLEEALPESIHPTEKKQVFGDYEEVNR